MFFFPSRRYFISSYDVLAFFRLRASPLTCERMLCVCVYLCASGIAIIIITPKKGTATNPAGISIVSHRTIESLSAKLATRPSLFTLIFFPFFILLHMRIYRKNKKLNRFYFFCLALFGLIINVYNI